VKLLSLTFATALIAATQLVGASAVHAFPLDNLQDKSDIGVNKIPNSGTSHILVIPMTTGGPFNVQVLAQLRDYFDPAGGPGTFRKYWQDVSGGRYDPIPTVVDPVEYLTTCPLPNRTLDMCEVTIADTDLFFGGGLGIALSDVLTRLRDEQNVDLSQFDVNGADGQPDGYFDGVIMESSMYEGIAMPLAALDNEAVVPTLPGGTGPDITLSLAAFAPPELHEFAHLFGFIDQYQGPTVNDVMAEGGYAGETDTYTLSAFNRLSIGWGEVTKISEVTEGIVLEPVMHGGTILQVGEAPRYMLIENRGGDLHAEWDASAAGIYMNSVNEEALPIGEFGWLNPSKGALFLPNEGPPYLNIAVPINCSLARIEDFDACVLARVGQERILVHNSGDRLGLKLRIDEVNANGNITVSLVLPSTEETTGGGAAAGAAPTEDDGGCAVSSRVGSGAVSSSASERGSFASAALMLLLFGGWLRRRRPRRRSSALRPPQTGA
jgi:hypothetical protein